jgi:DNA invertase Pin-like site-specific DNA recombinase
MRSLPNSCSPTSVPAILPTRPGLNSLVAAAEDDPPFNRLYVREHSRLRRRNPVDLARLVDRFASAGVEVLAAREGRMSPVPITPGPDARLNLPSSAAWCAERPN